MSPVTLSWFCYFSVENMGVAVHPNHAQEWINNGALNRFLDIINQLMVNRGHVFVQRCWYALLGKPNLHPPYTICDVLLCSPGFPFVLVTLADSPDQYVFEYNIKLARTLKRVLAEEAKCVEEFLVKPFVINTADLDSGSFTDAIFSWNTYYYPEKYCTMDRDKYFKVLESLAVVLIRVASNVSSNAGLKHFMMLTKKQYAILDNFYRRAAKVLITGLPGTGKTVLAFERIRQLRVSLHVPWERILYVCSNKCLEASVLYM